jgi:putative PIN family toxin of toxin-antitoxin system
MNVVADTNVVVSAIFWPGKSRDCLALWAKRRCHLALTRPIFDEYCEVAARVALKIQKVNPEPWLGWIEEKAKFYEPAPLGKPRSRDPDDDPFLSCALASASQIIISKDNDLLVLEKRFGIEILTPQAFLKRLR